LGLPPAYPFKMIQRYEDGSNLQEYWTFPPARFSSRALAERRLYTRENMELISRHYFAIHNPTVREKYCRDDSGQFPQHPLIYRTAAEPEAARDTVRTLAGSSALQLLLQHHTPLRSKEGGSSP